MGKYQFKEKTDKMKVPYAVNEIYNCESLSGEGSKIVVVTTSQRSNDYSIICHCKFLTPK